MPRIKLTLAYDGTDYVGWQVQLNGPSVQARLEQALAELLGQPVGVEAAGRTDSGVHATGQVVAFDSPRALPEKAYWMGLNGLLPSDIAVVAAEEVAPEFDPRRWALGRRYRYAVSNRRARSPLLRRYHWEVFQPLDLEAMRQALPALLGKHDFSAFRAADCQAAHARRELTALALEGQGGDVLSLHVEGTAFLKHMVRNLVGTLVEVGRGRQPPGWVGEVLAAGDRTRAGPTAPPHGLCLEEVSYGPGPREEALPEEG
jgi:tRNA pseudouridine38-40 synthase